MISVIITAYKEEETITKALQYIVNPEFSGYNEEIELIQISPDKPTRDAGESYCKQIQNNKLKYKILKDDNIGKPHALNVAMKEVSSDVVVLTDGDVFFEKGALGKLVNEFKNRYLGIACGKVVSINSTNNFMGYISHLMTEAAHHKRLIKLNNVKTGIGAKLVEKSNFFPLTGYMLIFNKAKLERKLGEGFVFPTDCLVDDAYLSYVAYNYNLEMGYIPEALVKVKFPTNYADYFKQKKRSTGGYVQLWKYGVIKNNAKARSFWHELRYFWFPLKYMVSSENSTLKFPNKLIWTLIFYPLRFWLWIQIWWERKFREKDFTKTWVRIESTK